MLEDDIGKIIESTLSDEANGRMKVNIAHLFVCFQLQWHTFVLGMHMVTSFYFNAHDPDASIAKHV